MICLRYSRNIWMLITQNRKQEIVKEQSEVRSQTKSRLLLLINLFHLCGWTLQGASNPTSTFTKPALTRFCVCLRIRILLIWKWVANPMPCLHCHKWHADWSLDCNRTGGNFFICNGSARDFALAKSARTCKYKERVG